jgi:hypothetical protein
MSVQDMRAELKMLRQDHPDYRPVSKMKKADISSLLEKMKQSTETTPMIAMTKGDPVKPAKGEVLKVKAVSESKVTKLPEAKAKKVHVEEHHKVDEKPKKEGIKERMARLRAMKSAKKE